MGQNSDVGLVLDGALTLTVPRAGRREMEVKVVVEEPVPAPIKAGDRIAKLVVTAPDMVPAERPLFAAADVAELDFVGRVGASLKHFIFGAAESVRASAK
jgi:D-alanyl-D-alanine carboxypeptidase (penicillin-binding protein 5/6)